jgi:bifunctional UDP-N-acetylglucosamine pyrophosphorylase/glucosamine-1-phosphate N-acetyltransferase
LSFEFHAHIARIRPFVGSRAVAGVEFTPRCPESSSPRLGAASHSTLPGVGPRSRDAVSSMTRIRSPPAAHLPPAVSARSPIQVVILAAGEGKRMRSRRPKVLHSLAGRPLLEHVVNAARSVEPRAIAVVVGRGADDVRAAMQRFELAYVTQDPPKGTGDAVRLALDALPDDGVTMVLIGDAPLVPPASLAELAQAASAEHLALVTARVPDASGLGRVVRDAQGRVRAIVEERDCSDAELAIREINAGMIAAPTRLLARWVRALKDDNAQHEFYLTDVIAMAAAEGVPIDAVVVADERDVRGVNDRAQLAALERIVQQRQADALMAAGATIVDPQRIDIRGALRCGADVTIDVGCVFEGDVQLADGVSVGPYCVLRDVAAGERTRIEPFTHIVDAKIGANCRIGPFARLRPGNELANHVHIGNFVEIKASAIADRSKVNHLAYVGDTTVGRDVNVGAGTITCNYDGANKHRTVIEDDVHIGSDCQLIAPVTVHRGATLGAGTTLTSDAPADALTLSRVTQVSKPGWQRPRKK